MDMDATSAPPQARLLSCGWEGEGDALANPGTWSRLIIPTVITALP